MSLATLLTYINNRRLNQRLTNTGMPNWLVVLNDTPSQGEGWKAYGNGARPRLTLEILWTTSNVLSFFVALIGIDPGPRISDPIVSI